MCRFSFLQPSKNFCTEWYIKSRSCSEVCEGASNIRYRDSGGFREKGLPSGAETEIMQIPGQKSGLSLRYFYMLAGDDSFAKPDRHVLRFIKKYAGVDLGIQGAQELLQSTVHELNMNHPNVTVSWPITMYLTVTKKCCAIHMNTTIASLRTN